MRNILGDIRYSLRSLRRAPGFTTVAVAVLALGVGANTAIFSVVNSVVLNPLPYPAADRLALIWETDLKDGIKREGPSGPNFLDWREQSRSFEEMALLEIGTGTLTGSGEPEQVVGLRVTTNFLPMLGAHATIGREFTTAEGAGQTRYPVAVLTNEFWKRRFGSDHTIVGRKIILNSEPYTVIGVLSADFHAPMPADIYVPWPLAELRAKARTSHDFGVIARVKPGVSIAQAQAELSTIARRIDAKTPGLAGWDVSVIGLKKALFAYIRPAFLLLLASVGLLLLLACVNIASLLLARMTARRKEMAIRAALGAGRTDLVLQVLIESVCLSLAGGGFGVLVASWGVQLLNAVVPAALPLPDAGAVVLRPQIHLDAHVLGFALLISVTTALIFGAIPALYAAASGVYEALKSSSRTSSESVGRRSAWPWLVACEVAFASVLLIGGGLAMKSFVNIQHVKSGIQPDHVLTFQMRLPTDNLYKRDREQAQFYRQLIERVRQIPGIQSAGLTDVLPLGQRNDREYFTIENHPLPSGQTLVADFRRVDAGYFVTMGIPLLQGRIISDRDVREAPPVVVIDETMARQYWPHEDPIGQRVRLWGKYRQVVGIVGQVHHYALEKEPQPTIYAPFEQMPDKSMTLAVRTTMETQATVRSVKQAVYSVDPAQPVFQVRAMEDYVSLAETAPRISTILLTLFAVASLVLAAMGVHGVVSYGVAQRTREFGIRMALGSSSGQIKSLVVRGGVATAAFGLVPGIAIGIALSFAMRAFLYGVAPIDPGVIVGVAVLLLSVVLIADYLPARRATRIDPAQALHHE